MVGVRGVLVAVVTLASLCAARPKSVDHHVKPRKHAESSQDKGYFSKTPYTGNTKGANYNAKTPSLHKVKLYKDNIPFDPTDLGTKYDKSDKDTYISNPKNGDDFHPKKKVDFHPKNRVVEDKKAPDEFAWPKLDDTDIQPDPITKPAQKNNYQWVKRDKCDQDYDCPPGRTCHHGYCQCMTPELCYHHHQPVCGSDGLFYPSHCELHRTACVEQRHIRIDHKGACFQQTSDSEKPGFVDVNNKEKVTKKVLTKIVKKPDLKIQTSDKISQPKDKTAIDTKKQTYDVNNRDKDSKKHIQDNDYDDDDDDAPIHPPANPDSSDEYEYDDYHYNEDDKKKGETIHKDFPTTKKYTDNTQYITGKTSTNTKQIINKKTDKPTDKNTDYKHDKVNLKDKYYKDDITSYKDNPDNLLVNKPEKVDTKDDSNSKKKAPPKLETSKEKESPYLIHSDVDAKEVKKSQVLTSNPACSQHEYNEFKERVLKFHCDKFGEPDCDAEVVNDRMYLAKLMFKFYDGNIDKVLTFDELNDASLEKGETCSMVDMFKYEVLTVPGAIDLGDIYKIFKLKKPQLYDQEQITEVIATVGHGLELSCGIHGGGGDIIWQRHGINVKDLHMSDITSFRDGSLYISRVSVHHAGNFTCHEGSDPKLVQTHYIRVQMVPTVLVIPATQLHRTHSDVIVKCHVEGVPRPRISWQINEIPLPNDGHYIRMQHNNTLLIHDADYERDTGAYKCVAENEAGTAQHITTVFIENINGSRSYLEDRPVHGYFAVFHDTGYTVYDPFSCNNHHYVPPDFHHFSLPTADQTNGDKESVLCPGATCMWGNAILVKEYIYVSQPEQNRVVVIEAKDSWNPIQIINTDKVPEAVHYMKHLDQVWVLCWNGNENSGSKTIVVVRDASKAEPHRIVHTQPVGDKFDLVENLFLAPSNDLDQTFPHGYVIHTGQHGLYKLDIGEMKYVKSVDLTTYDCRPLHVAFVPLGGKVLVQCQTDSAATISYFLLELDYLSDKVLRKIEVRGKPFVTPDSRNVVVLDDDVGDVNVYSVSDEGVIKNEFVVTTSAIISDHTFHPATHHNGYDLYLNSHMRDKIYAISLLDGKFQTVTGEDVWESQTWIYDSPYHSITGGGLFGDYVLKTSDAGVMIIKGKSHEVQCEFSDGERGHEVVWVGP